MDEWVYQLALVAYNHGVPITIIVLSLAIPAAGLYYSRGSKQAAIDRNSEAEQLRLARKDTLDGLEATVKRIGLELIDLRKAYDVMDANRSRGWNLARAWEEIAYQHWLKLRNFVPDLAPLPNLEAVKEKPAP